MSIVGRPNVGKSTLLNRILGRKVSIVSDKPQTTRTQVRGVLNRPEGQIVFVDTPGIHKPRTLMGERLNDSAIGTVGDVDVVCLMLDATGPVGRGDRWVAARVPEDAVVIVNKCDLVGRHKVLDRLAAASDMTSDEDGSSSATPSTPPDREYFPVSARTGAGVDALVEHLFSRMPIGPHWYPDDMVTDVEDAFWVAELVREQLLALTRDELPHSIACRVTEWDWPRVRVEILVERESQKGIVIGRRGAVLKEVGTRARRQMAPGAFLELHVKVDKDWQRRPKALDRLGY
ncbi:MAG: GTPase Era [Microthrixaceae bacterium]